MALAAAENADLTKVSTSFVEDRESWLRVEQELLDAGIAPSLFHRWAWTECIQRSGHRLVVARDGAQRLLGAIAVRALPSRALPGHIFLRVTRFGDPFPEAAWEPLITALKENAQADSRVLRLSIEIFSRESLRELGAAMERHGFHKSTQPRSYRHTLTLDLRSTEQEVFAVLHKTARNNLRPSTRAAVDVVHLTQAIFADKINQLRAEAMNRTGGNTSNFDASDVLELSRRYPHLSRVAGLFLAGAEQHPDNLVGFAWGCMHGGYAEYRAAGTTRLPGRNIAISYPLLWELIVWAKREDATWFDLGGVTVDDEDEDSLRGISDFKRYFSRNVEEVGEEWLFEPHPARLYLATLSSRLAETMTGLRSKLRSRPQQGAHEA